MNIEGELTAIRNLAKDGLLKGARDALRMLARRVDAAYQDSRERVSITCYCPACEGRYRRVLFVDHDHVMQGDLPVVLCNICVEGRAKVAKQLIARFRAEAEETEWTK